jgi:hypothetical protein
VQVFTPPQAASCYRGHAALPLRCNQAAPAAATNLMVVVVVAVLLLVVQCGVCTVALCGQCMRGQYFDRRGSKQQNPGPGSSDKLTRQP